MSMGNPAGTPGVVPPERTMDLRLEGTSMVTQAHDFDSILIGSELAGRTIYRATPGEHGRRWVRYQVRPDGSLDNPVVVFTGERPAHWRGLPEFE